MFGCIALLFTVFGAILDSISDTEPQFPGQRLYLAARLDGRLAAEEKPQRDFEGGQPSGTAAFLAHQVVHANEPPRLIVNIQIYELL